MRRGGGHKGGGFGGFGGFGGGRSGGNVLRLILKHWTNLIYI